MMWKCGDKDKRTDAVGP